MPGDGPIPKRADVRRRRNKENAPEVVQVQAPAPDVPAADSDWHPIASDWFESLKESGQSQFYEASDWAVARYVAEAMSRNLESARFSAQLFASVMAGMTELLTTEGARRRARLELERVQSADAPPEVAIMDRYRKAAKASA